MGAPGPHLCGPLLPCIRHERGNPLFWPLGARVPQQAKEPSAKMAPNLNQRSANAAARGAKKLPLCMATCGSSKRPPTYKLGIGPNESMGPGTRRPGQGRLTWAGTAICMRHRQAHIHHGNPPIFLFDLQVGHHSQGGTPSRYHLERKKCQSGPSQDPRTAGLMSFF